MTDINIICNCSLKLLENASKFKIPSKQTSDIFLITDKLYN